MTRTGVLVFCTLMLTTVTAHANYESDIMKPWIGATQDELVSKWGYPQSTNDFVKIDNEITIFTYRSRRGGWGGPQSCIVSFTLKNKKVIAWKYEGGKCPLNKR